MSLINVKVSSLNIGAEKVSIQNPTLRVIISLISFVFGMKCRLPFNREKAMRYGRLYLGSVANEEFYGDDAGKRYQHKNVNRGGKRDSFNSRN